MRVLICLLLTVAVGAYVASGCDDDSQGPRPREPGPPVDGWTMTGVAAADALGSALTPDQLRRALYAFDDPARTEWSNLPANLLEVERPGVRLGDLDAMQRAAVFSFLDSQLSASGAALIRQIVAADAVLEPRDVNDFGWSADNYWFAFYGTPSSTEPWGWGFGGHHLAVNMTIRGDAMTLAPTFLGVEPAEFTVEGAQAAPLSQRYADGVALMNALDATQQRAARVNERPEEVITGPGEDGVVPPLAGAVVGDWPPAQKTQLLALVGLWTQMMPPTAAEGRQAALANTVDQLRFAWHGALDGASPIYYRIQGPSLILEFSSEGAVGAGEGDHFHSVWRDPTNEYGAEWVR
jgi:hypothetical protein